MTLKVKLAWDVIFDNDKMQRVRSNQASTDTYKTTKTVLIDCFARECNY